MKAAGQPSTMPVFYTVVLAVVDGRVTERRKRVGQEAFREVWDTPLEELAAWPAQRRDAAFRAVTKLAKIERAEHSGLPAQGQAQPGRHHRPRGRGGQL